MRALLARLVLNTVRDERRSEHAHTHARRSRDDVTRLPIATSQALLLESGCSGRVDLNRSSVDAV